MRVRNLFALLLALIPLTAYAHGDAAILGAMLFAVVAIGGAVIGVVWFLSNLVICLFRPQRRKSIVKQFILPLLLLIPLGWYFAVAAKIL